MIARDQTADREREAGYRGRYRHMTLTRRCHDGLGAGLCDERDCPAREQGAEDSGAGQGEVVQCRKGCKVNRGGVETTNVRARLCVVQVAVSYTHLTLP